MATLLMLIALLPSASAGRYRSAKKTQIKVSQIDKLDVIKHLRLSHFEVLEENFNSLIDNYNYARSKNKIAHEKNLVQAFSAFHFGDPTLTPQFNRWVRHSPKSITPLLARAIHLWRLGWFVRGTSWGNKTSKNRFEEMESYFQQADNDFKKVLSLNGKLSIAWGYRLNMMNTLSNNLQWQTASLAQLYYVAISKNPKSAFIPDNYFLRLQTRWGGSHARMISALGRLKLLRTNEQDIKYLFGFLSYAVGRNELSQKQYKKALKAFQAAEQFGVSARYSRSEALAYYGLKQYKHALIAITKTIRLEPQSPENLALKARILWKLDRRNVALDIWEKALALSPYDPDIAQWYGYALRQKGYFKKALFILKRSQYFGQENHEIYAMQGNIQLYHTYDFNLAALNFAKARELAPSNLNYLFSEGSSLVMAKQSQKGIPLLRKYAQFCNTSHTKCKTNQISWVNEKFCSKAEEMRSCGIKTEAQSSLTFRLLRWLY